MDTRGAAGWRAWLAQRGGRWDRRDAAVAALAAAAVLARWADRARHLMSWDANTFALALERYDMRALRPHAPGYPLYVALGRVSKGIFPDANEALVALSLAFTAAAAVLAYGLGRSLASRGAGLAAALLLLAAPVAYVHSVTANVYPADLACSLAVAWAAWAAHHRPTPLRAVVLALLFSFAVGVRPSILLFLAPVAAWGALRPPRRLREQVRLLLPAAALAAAVALAWFLPMAQASGGLASWREANGLQSGQVVFKDTVLGRGWPALAENLGRLGLYLRWELALALPVLTLLVGGAALLRGRHAPQQQPQPPTPSVPPSPPPWSGPWTFLAAWALPPLLFYAFVFSGWNEGPSGYVLVVLPALLLGGILAARAALGWLRQAGASPAAVGAVAAAALLGPAAGLALHAHDVADVDYRAHDAWAESWSRLPESFPPSNSSIVASWHFAHAWYAFPDYTSYNHRPPAEGPGQTPDFLLTQEARHREAEPDWYDAIAQRKTAGPHLLGPAIRHLVLLDFQLAGENGGPRRVLPDVPVREAFLPNGWRILVLDTTPGQPHLEDYFSMQGAA